MLPTSRLSPKFNTITAVRNLNNKSGKSKPQVLNDVQKKLENILSINPVINRGNSAAMLFDVPQKKLAIKLAIKMIQENMNHGGTEYFNDENYYGEIHNASNVSLGAKALFNSIMDGSQRCEDGESLKSKLEFLCCHRNTLITNRKFSFYKTNYTNSAKELRRQVENFVPGSCNVVFDRSGRPLSNFVSPDIRNLDVQRNHGSSIITFSTQGASNYDPYRAGKWCAEIKPENINIVMGIMRNLWPSTLSEVFLVMKVFLVEGNNTYLDPKTGERGKPKTFNAIFYIGDYRNKRNVTEAYNALVKAGIITQNQNINFKREQETMVGSDGFLFSFDTMDQYYQKGK